MFITLLWMYTYMIYSFSSPVIGSWHLGDIKTVYHAGVLWCSLSSDIDSSWTITKMGRNMSFYWDKKLIDLLYGPLTIFWPGFIGLAWTAFKWETFKMSVVLKKRHPRKLGHDVTFLHSHLSEVCQWRHNHFPGRQPYFQSVTSHSAGVFTSIILGNLTDLLAV